MNPLHGIAVLAIAVATFAPGSDADAAPPPPTDLKVKGGEETWHPVNRFRLDWKNPQPTLGLAVAAVHYRVRDVSGTPIGADERIDWATDRIDDLSLPGPGVYTAEVWLEDTLGKEGAAAATKLRFDDVVPAAAALAPYEGWIGRTGFPFTIRIVHPDGTPPTSGIRGYAVSVDRVLESSPCDGATSCTDAETDLRDGESDDSFRIGELPEGTSYVHAMAVSGSGLRSAAPAHTALRVDKTDPLTELDGAPNGWANRSVPLIATATDTGSGMGNVPATAAFTAIQIDAGTPEIDAGNSISATVIAEGVHTISYFARDAAGNVNDGATSNGQTNHPPRMAVVRIDKSPPTVSFLNSQDPEDPELIRVRVLNPLSGPSRSRGSVGVRQAGSGDPFEALPTESTSAGLQARWDSDAYPQGTYEFQATGYDAAGNRTRSVLRLDGAEMVLPNPLKTPTALVATLGSGKATPRRCAHRRPRRDCRIETPQALEEQRFIPFGREIPFSGRLATGPGTPLGEIDIQIVERFGGKAAERVTTVTSKGDGTFSTLLVPGPSREITAVFAGSRMLARSAAAPIRLGVRSRVQLRVSSRLATIGGPPIVFSGRVESAPGEIPSGGKSVELQFRLPGLPWSEFRTVETDRLGRFRYGYRFSDDDSRGARFQFRARTPAQSDWPYEPGDSRPVAVRGR